MSRLLGGTGRSTRGATDPLTALATRSALLERLTQCLTTPHRAHSSTVLLYVDIDDFALVNERLGTTGGDQALQEVARRLVEAADESGFVARVGSNAFAVISELRPTAAGALDIARLVSRALHRPVTIGQTQLRLRASIGIAAIADAPGEDPQQMLRQAEVAMRSGRSQGRGGAEIYRKIEAARDVRRMQLEHDLDEAIERNQLSLRYQPIADLATSKRVGVEALLRWFHTDAGRVDPVEVISSAESAGLSDKLTNWVIEQVCTDVANWDRRGLVVDHIAINVTTLQFNVKMVCQLEETMKRRAIAPERVWLELASQRSDLELDPPASVLDEVHSIGVRTMLDGFGTAGATMHGLQVLNFDGMKIARPLVSNIGRSERDDTLADAATRLGRDLGLTVCAVGIESDAQRDWLAERGCVIGQGFLFAPGLPADALATQFDER